MSVRFGIFPVSALVLAVAQAVLVLFSWIASSVSPALPVRSMLSGEGVRWFVGSFAGNMACPLSSWLLLCSLAYGAFVSSGAKDVFSRRGFGAGRRLNLNVRAACAAALSVVLLSLLLSLLSFVPHAVLLGVDGSLFPGAFSAGIVPFAAFAVTLASVVYGLSSGAFACFGDIFKGVCSGAAAFAPLVPIYVLAVQLYYSVRFVFFL